MGDAAENGLLWFFSLLWGEDEDDDDDDDGDDDDDDDGEPICAFVSEYRMARWRPTSPWGNKSF